jgi:hypothetical protein
VTIYQLRELLELFDGNLEIKSTVEEEVDDGEGYTDKMEVDVNITGLMQFETVVYINWLKNKE